MEEKIQIQKGRQINELHLKLVKITFMRQRTPAKSTLDSDTVSKADLTFHQKQLQIKNAKGYENAMPLLYVCVCVV